MEEEQDAADRCREIIAEGVCFNFKRNFNAQTNERTDGCAVEKDYSGPILPSEPWEPSAADQKRPPKERYSITQEFLAALLQWYASGKSLPRRYVWEIVLGAYDAFKKEESMVEVTVEDGETADVIGDVHGECECFGKKIYPDKINIFSSFLSYPQTVKYANSDVFDKPAARCLFAVRLTISHLDLATPDRTLLLCTPHSVLPHPADIHHYWHYNFAARAA